MFWNATIYKFNNIQYPNAITVVLLLLHVIYIALQNVRNVTQRWK